LKNCKPKKEKIRRLWFAVYDIENEKHMFEKLSDARQFAKENKINTIYETHISSNGRVTKTRKYRVINGVVVSKGI